MNVRSALTVFFVAISWDLGEAQYGARGFRPQGPKFELPQKENADFQNQFKPTHESQDQYNGPTHLAQGGGYLPVNLPIGPTSKPQNQYTGPFLAAQSYGAPSFDQRSSEQNAFSNQYQEQQPSQLGPTHLAQSYLPVNQPNGPTSKPQNQNTGPFLAAQSYGAPSFDQRSSEQNAFSNQYQGQQPSQIGPQSVPATSQFDAENFQNSGDGKEILSRQQQNAQNGFSRGQNQFGQNFDEQIRINQNTFTKPQERNHFGTSEISQNYAVNPTESRKNPEATTARPEDETDPSEEDSVASAVAKGKYYVVQPDGRLQRVVYNTQREGNNGFSAKLVYQNVEPLTAPIYSFGYNEPLIRIN